jgi:class 3 adenylate cyclase
MSSFPSGSVTLLFTDIEGSTRLWEEQPDAMSSALAVHDSILREEIERAGGIVFKTVGDAFHAAFGEAENALAAALMAQQRLLAAGLPFRVRAALHSGEPQLRDGDYFGTPLNRLARILATGHGGQILVSSATRYMAMDRLPAGRGSSSTARIASRTSRSRRTSSSSLTITCRASSHLSARSRRTPRTCPPSSPPSLGANGKYAS